MNRLRSPYDRTLRRRNCAHAQFGSGIVFDPTQSGHAIVQIEHEEQSMPTKSADRERPTNLYQYREDRYDGPANLQHRQQQYNLYHQMMTCAADALSALSLATSDLMLMQQISNTYGNSMGWLNASNTGTGASAPISRRACRALPT